MSASSATLTRPARASTAKPIDLSLAAAQIAKAQLMVSALCQGERRWTMSIPASTDDPDLVIAAGLEAGRRMLGAISGAVSTQIQADAPGSPDIDHPGMDKVEALIAAVRAAGLMEAAEAFSNAYWAWLRITQAYAYAHPYVATPDEGMTPITSLHVVDFAFRHWAQLVPGSPMLNDRAVLREAERDEAWHRGEDRRLRRSAGEDI